MTGQVTAPLLQAFSLHHPSYARANRRLSLPLLPSYEPLPSSSGPLSLTLVIRAHADWAGNPQHPCHAVHLLSRRSWASCWHLPFFLSAASSQPSSHGTVNSTRMIFFFSSGDHMMMSGLRVGDSTASGKWNFLPRSTPSLGSLQEVLPCLVVDDRSLAQC